MILQNLKETVILLLVFCEVYSSRVMYPSHYPMHDGTHQHKSYFEGNNFYTPSKSRGRVQFLVIHSHIAHILQINLQALQLIPANFGNSFFSAFLKQREYSLGSSETESQHEEKHLISAETPAWWDQSGCNSALCLSSSRQYWGLKEEGRNMVHFSPTKIRIFKCLIQSCFSNISQLYDVLEQFMSYAALKFDRTQIQNAKS